MLFRAGYDIVRTLETSVVRQICGNSSVVERSAVNRNVVGSSPTWGATKEEGVSNDTPSSFVKKYSYPKQLIQRTKQTWKTETGHIPKT